MSKPRCAHYQLAHVALRSVAFKAPLEFMSHMAGDKNRELLTSLLEQVNDHCADDSWLESEEILLHRTRLLGSPCLIVEMPEAVTPPEAHFVGIWLAMNDGPEMGVLRYFTLEAGGEAEGAETVLGEWDMEGKHVNYGAGPQPSLDAFVQALTGLVARYH